MSWNESKAGLVTKPDFKEYASLNTKPDFKDAGSDTNQTLRCQFLRELRSALGLEYDADMATDSFSVELWKLASWTSSAEFLDVGFSVLFCRMVPCCRSASWNEWVLFIQHAIQLGDLGSVIWSFKGVLHFMASFWELWMCGMNTIHRNNNRFEYD
ncbi:hypothetical protein RhiirA4_477097 [Rhizophagus irregularis]|uniref:Uncharacterized protein n=1 Tax=Rhizophagus irregularis TaxID=588596 RepID=A0A2I1HCN0_9GLOM|nr:hypothetical protein RhiirA4_477097 [Rhizophagus irregularis]